MSQEMIIYISKATKPLQPHEVERIAIASAVRNQKSDVTGMLLQIANFYVQVLEGDSWKLSSLLEKIETDGRHSDLHILYKTSVPSKLFGQWSMGYFNLEKYYYANKLDIVRLRQYAEEAFAANKTSQKAIIQVIRSIPAVCFT